MSKTTYISFFFLLQLTLLSAQEIFKADNIDIESMDGKQSYNWVSNFNKSNLSVEKRTQKTHKLDSIHGFYRSSSITGKVDYIFLEDKDISLSYNFDLDLEQYIPDNIQVQYYENNLLTKTTYGLWEGNSSNYEEGDPLIISYYTYKENNQIKGIESLSGTAVANGQGGSLRKFKYDNDNNLTVFTILSWNNDSQTYDQTFIRKYDHDDQGNLIEVVDHDYSVDFGWFIQDSTVYTYNSSSVLLQEDWYSMGPIRDTFKYQVKRTYDYNDNGTINQILENRSPSSSNPGTWNLHDLFVYNYSPKGSLTSLAKYDVKNPFLDYYWEEQLERSSYEYDESITADQIQYRRFRFTQFGPMDRYNQNHMLLKEKYYKGGNQFEVERFEQGLEYFYSKIETSSTSNIVSDHNISVYPNPTSDYITFELPNLSRASDLTLTDINCQLVLSQKYTPREKLSVRELKSGVYIYSLVVGGRAYVGRFVITD